MFDLENAVVKICAAGMEKEGAGLPGEAAELFASAWEAAQNDYEKSIAAHYVARHQYSVDDKLKWDLLALTHAKNVEGETFHPYLPSLFLNIAKCYEDLGDLKNAEKNYREARNYLNFLPADGYGVMIRKGVEQGLSRIQS